MPRTLLSLSLAGLMAVTTGTWAADTAERLAVLDFGALDIIAELDQRQRVAGLAKQGLPEHLGAFADEAYRDLGSLVDVDMARLASIEPDTIVISGRLSDSREALQAIAPVVQTGAKSPDDYWAGLSTEVTSLGQRLGLDAEADTALRKLREDLDASIADLPPAAEVLVVLHNDGNLVYQDHALVNGLMGLASPTLPADVERVTRGERTFTALTVEQIASMSPDLVWIIDRSAAIGQDGLDLDAFTASLGADSTLRVAKGSPRLWYLAGLGIESTRLKVQEVTQALEPALNQPSNQG